MSASRARRPGGDQRSVLPRHARALASVIACAMCSLALPLDPADAENDFTDFRIPSNRSLLWTAALSSRTAGGENSIPGSNVKSGALNGDLSTQLSWLSDSDPKFTSFFVEAAVSGVRRHGTTDNEMSTPPSAALQTYENSERQVLESWGLGASHRTYPWTAPLGIEASASASGDYDQTWTSNDNQQLLVNPGATFQTTTSDHAERWDYLTTFTASAAVGYGRVRNATSIYDAVVLEQRLRETGALTRPLSREGRMRLAEVLYLRGSLDEVRDRPGRALWSEIERVLADDGALQEGGLDPYSVLRAAEPHLGASRALSADGVPISPVARLTGAFVGPIVLDLHLNRIRRDDEQATFESIQNGVVVGSGSVSTSSRSEDPVDQVSGGLTGEIHLPLGSPWQLDANGSVLLGLRAQDNSLRGQSQVSLVWLAADRWTANVSAAYSRLDADRTQGPAAEDSWNWNAGLGISWYVEDHTAIQLSGRQGQFWKRGDPDATPATDPSRMHIFARSLDATLGVTYRFSGWIATPGFFPARRIVAPTGP